MSAIRMIQDRIDMIIRDIDERRARIEECQKKNEVASATIENLTDIIYELRNEIDMRPYVEIWLDGRKIEAIKDYRRDTGYTLTEAKLALESAANNPYWNKAQA